MTYHFSSRTKDKFSDAISTVKQKLSDEGFGILSEIDVKSKMKEKLNIDFRNYTILGACNPMYAHQALTAEPYIGTMLPCNVVVQEWPDGQVEVSAIDPVASMQAIDNPQLEEIAEAIREKLQKVIATL